MIFNCLGGGQPLVIDPRLKTVVVKPIKEAQIIKDAHLKKSIVKDHPQEKRWEQLKYEEVERLLKKTKRGY